MEDFKTCLKCEEEKYLKDFHNCKKYEDGKKTICKECSNEYMMEYRERPEVIKKAREKAKKKTEEYRKNVLILLSNNLKVLIKRKFQFMMFMTKI